MPERLLIAVCERSFAFFAFFHESKKEPRGTFGFAVNIQAPQMLASEKPLPMVNNSVGY